MKLTQDTNSAYRYLIAQELNKKESELTGVEVLDHLFGHHNNDYQPKSRYTLRRYKQVKTKKIHRINAIWVYPLWIVLIAPIKWLLTGKTGVQTESKAYRVLRFLLGNPA